MEVMAKAELRREFYKGVLEGLTDQFEGGDLEELGLLADQYYEKLMIEDLGEAEEIYRDVLSFLVIQRSLYRLKVKDENPKDSHERAAFENLAWRYEAMLRVPESVGQHVYTYCSDECNAYLQRSMKYERQRWETITLAVQRIVAEEG